MSVALALVDVPSKCLVGDQFSSLEAVFQQKHLPRSQVFIELGMPFIHPQVNILQSFVDMQPEFLFVTIVKGQCWEFLLVWERFDFVGSSYELALESVLHQECILVKVVLVCGTAGSALFISSLRAEHVLGAAAAGPFAVFLRVSGVEGSASLRKRYISFVKGGFTLASLV